MVPINEEVHDMSNSDSDEEEEPIGTGNYWMKVRPDYPISQFIPMYGRKMEIYYRGMKQTCVNCYTEGHKKKDCKQEKRDWLE